MQNKSDNTISSTTDKALSALKDELAFVLAISKNSLWNGVSTGALAMVFLMNVVLMMWTHHIFNLIWAAISAGLILYNYCQHKKRNQLIIRYYELIMNAISENTDDNGQELVKCEK